MEKTKTISVIGLGYIGLPTAAVFASHRLRVIGVDIVQKAVDTINAGQIHIFEPDLDVLVRAAVAAGYLRATTKPEAADVFIIAVPTPFKENHEPDLSYIEAAIAAIAPVLKAGDLVVLESTSPVGTTQRLSVWMALARPDLTFPHTHGEASDIRVAYCPERVLPGRIVRELIQNDRIVGGLTQRCSAAIAALYKTFLEGECIITNARTAEMCKLTENSFRDVNIAFANELSIICDKLDVNVWELIRLANRHPRVNILQPGPGVGGHCIAVDPWFIVNKSPGEANLIRMARVVNDNKPAWVLEKIRAATTGKTDATIACFGLSFKPNIDDLRESPALAIALEICRGDWREVLLVEPNINGLPEVFLPFGTARLVDAEEALARADMVVLLVNHREFVGLRPVIAAHGHVIDAVGLL
jgi:UDP-N-acetyl-D-mannosaminuronic acid dehydrogenase